MGRRSFASMAGAAIVRCGFACDPGNFCNSTDQNPTGRLTARRYPAATSAVALCGAQRTRGCSETLSSDYKTDFARDMHLKGQMEYIIWSM
jgi:hypothetical protein